ncbi:MAG: shikimate dehydrogenase [Gammaproteobacteria bacterium]
MTDRYAVMGNPIGHSKSPMIHQQFAEQTRQDLNYEAIQVATDGFAEAVNAFYESGGKGLNITVPFKLQAWELANHLSSRAERAGAVNTLSFSSDGLLSGDNTDGVGLVRDLMSNHSIEINGKRLLLMGAGGAARGVISPLVEQKPESITIANRTVSRACELAGQFDDLGKIKGCGFNDLQGERFDIIINATAAGLDDEIPVLPAGVINTESICYDMMYSTEPTAFVRHAKQLGAHQAVDGLGMLVEQAAESFTLWRRVRPETQSVIAALR